MGGKDFPTTIWLPGKIGCHSNKNLYVYFTHFESDSNETWQVSSTNENLSKKNVIAWKIGYQGNSNETMLPKQL